MLVYGLEMSLTCPKCGVVVDTSEAIDPTNPYELDYRKMFLECAQRHILEGCTPCTCCKVHKAVECPCSRRTSRP